VQENAPSDAAESSGYVNNEPVLCMAADMGCVSRGDEEHESSDEQVGISK
jgi:hypothetical protein